MDELAVNNFPLLTENLKTESELDNITLDDLYLESKSLPLDPATTLLDFLQPEKRHMENRNPVSHKIKVGQDANACCLVLEVLLLDY